MSGVAPPSARAAGRGILSGILSLPALVIFIPLLSVAFVSCGGGGGGGGGSESTGGTAVVPPDNLHFAYVANFDDDTVSVLISNDSTGQLRHHGYVLTGDQPQSIAIDPTGRFAYTTNIGSDDVSVFAIDATTRALSAVDCNPVAAGIQGCATGIDPVSIAFNSAGAIAYVVNRGDNSISVHNIDQNTDPGVLSIPVQVFPVGGAIVPRTARLHPNGQVLYVTHEATGDVGIYRIQADGTLDLPTGAPSGGMAPVDVAFTPNGQFAFVANSGSGQLGVFTIAHGLLAPNGASVAAGNSVRALAMHQNGRWLYAANAGVAGSVSVFAVQASGTLNPVDCGATLHCPVGDTPEAIAVDPTGKFITVTNRNGGGITTFTINQTTGALTNSRSIAARSGPVSMAYLRGTPATITPRFAYVANLVSDDITTFAVNSTRGALTEVGTEVPAGDDPNSVTADLGGRFLYVANSRSNSVAAFEIDHSTGALTPTGVAVVPGTAPASVAVEPSGRFAYAANYNTDNVTVFVIDQATGTLAQTATAVAAGDAPRSISVDPRGRFAYVVNFFSGNVTIFEIDPTTGVLIGRGTVAAGSFPLSVSVHPNGQFAYVANWGSDDMTTFAIDPVTGALTPLVPTVPAGDAPASISIDAYGRFAYVTNVNSPHEVSTFAINSSSGNLALSSTVPTGSSPYSITTDPSGRFAYVANQGSNSVTVFSISSTNGNLTQVGGEVPTGLGPQSVVTVGFVQ